MAFLCSGFQVKFSHINPSNGEARMFWDNKVNAIVTSTLGPLLLTWFNLNLNMDK